ncbi:MAG: DNA replication/repair protein RecF [Thermomicrobiales bacterium]
MHLKSLLLEEFRSYQRQLFELTPRGLALYGANASGKSTVLEAIAMLAMTRSPRTSTERDLIRWQSGVELGVPPFGRIDAVFERAGEQTEMTIGIQADPNRPTQIKKQIKLNGRPVRAMDAVGRMNAVLFSPEDVALVSGPPSIRRRYLDLVISQIDRRYLRALARFSRMIEQRNSLLRSLGREGVPPGSEAAGSQLAYWDQELIRLGSQIIARRCSTVRRLSNLAAIRFVWLAKDSPLGVIYTPSLEGDWMAQCDDNDQLDAIQRVVAREYEHLLPGVRGDELRRGLTLLGPHRDDLRLEIEGHDLAAFGSRGQQRLAVVALKLAEADLMREETGEEPVQLLDDVLSELDPEHRALLIRAIGESGGQVILTAADPALFRSSELAGIPVLEVKNGAVREPAN